MVLVFYCLYCNTSGPVLYWYCIPAKRPVLSILDGERGFLLMCVEIIGLYYLNFTEISKLHTLAPEICVHIYFKFICKLMITLLLTSWYCWFFIIVLKEHDQWLSIKFLQDFYETFIYLLFFFSFFFLFSSSFYFISKVHFYAIIDTFYCF